MDIKVEIQPKEIIAKVETPNEPIYGGTKDYTKLDNLPSINGSVIIGDMTLLQLGIQPQGDYAERSELPVNVSELYNDAGYLVQSDLSDYAKTENIPTKVSELENDSDYATTMQIPTKTSQLSNDSEFAYTKDIPTKVSQLANDSDYAAKSDLPTKTSELINDSNLAYVSDIPTKFSELENDSLKNVDNTSDENKPVSIAQRKAIDDAYANSNAYTDQKIADLIGGAPETLDTLKEVADAIAESKDVEEALNSAIGTKANQAELDTHTGNNTIHITSTERENWNDANDKKHTHSNKSVIDKITQTLLDSWNAAYTHISDTVKHITSDERTAWNNKYSKPSGGIPKTDLASSVQESLGKADTALQAHQDISGLATKTELTTHTNNIDNPHSVTKSQVGLGNVNNTSDKDKPISTAQQAEFDKLNSNLDALEYSDVAGGKNLFDGVFIADYILDMRTDYTEKDLMKSDKNLTKDITGKTFVTIGRYLKKGTYTLSYTNNAWFSFNRVAIAGTNSELAIESVRKSYTWTQNVDGYTYFTIEGDDSESGVTDTPFSITPNIQIEVGTIATDYEHYIPSVKMLAEKTTQIDDNNMLGWVVPEEMPIKNYVDSNGVFHQRVGRVDLGSLKFDYDANVFFTKISQKNIYCYLYKFVDDTRVVDNNTAGNYLENMTFTYRHGTIDRIYFKNTSYTDATTFKNAMKGVYLYYELATEQTISVDGNEAVTKVNDSLSVIGKCKNLLNPTLQTTTSNGVTCTNNGDGTYTLNGTSTDSRSDIYLKTSLSLKKGTYKIIYGVNCWIQLNHSNGSISDRIFTLDSDTVVDVRLGFNKGIVFDNVIVKPMITTDLTATYDDFVPYTGDGDTLTHDVAELKNDLVSLKNLFSSNITGIKLNGTTLEVSFNNGTSKGIVTFDGIAEEETIIS